MVAVLNIGIALGVVGRSPDVLDAVLVEQLLRDLVAVLRTIVTEDDLGPAIHEHDVLVNRVGYFSCLLGLENGSDIPSCCRTGAVEYVGLPIFTTLEGAHCVEGPLFKRLRVQAVLRLASVSALMRPRLRAPEAVLDVLLDITYETRPIRALAHGLECATDASMSRVWGVMQRRALAS